MNDQKKRRSPRFDDILALSHQPPKKQTVSPFTLAYDAEQRRRQEGLQKFAPTDVVIPEPSALAGKSEPLAGKFAGKSESLASKWTNRHLPVEPDLPANSILPATADLPANRPAYPSWQVPKVTIRVPNTMQDALRFIGLSKGLSFQDTVLLAITNLLASEGLPANSGLPATLSDLPANGICQLPDQMIDDVLSVRTSSVINQPKELLNYYSKWTENPIREKDWQTLRAVTSYSPLAIKAGILLSILRAKTKVNSFKYCLGAIREVAESGIKNREEYIRHLERKVESQAQSPGQDHAR